MFPQLRQLKTKTRRLVAELGKGVNNGHPAFDIKANYMSDAQNLDSRSYPAVKVRNPRDAYADALTNTPYGLYKRKSDYVLAVDGTDWNYWDGSAWQTIGALTETEKASQVNFNEYSLIVNGTDGKYWDGDSTYADIPTLPSGIDRLVVHPDRVFGSSSTDDVLYISALGKWNDWTTADDAGQIQMYTEDGQYNTGLAFYNDHVIYFKRNHMFELFGSIPSNFSPQHISSNTGCVAHRTIKEVQGYLFWLGDDGVYMYGGGTAPKLISYPYIGDTIDDIDTTNIAEACAGTDGERYYLCLPVGSNARQVITYDVKTDAWHLEDSESFVDFVNLDGVLYGMGTDKQIYEMVGDGDEEISWYLETKKFNDFPSAKHSVRNLYIIMTLPTGSSMKCAVKTEEGSYVDVKTFSVDTDINLQRVQVPLTSAQNTSWYQIKLYGTGPCTIYKLEIQSRVRSDSYNG